MKTYKLMMAAAAAAMSLGLIGCTSNGSDGGISGGGTTGGIGGAGTTGGLANDGSIPTDITQGGTSTTIGTAVSGNFICTRSALEYGNATTEVGSNGLVGGPLTDLLNGLGGTTLTDLLNSISEPNNVIDGYLNTYASVSFTAGLLLGLIDSIDESVILPAGQSVPAGKYAVFGVSFPNGTADVSLLNSITVATFKGGAKQEFNTLDQNALTLLKGIGGSIPYAAFIGVKTSKAYDTAQISLTPGVITASVGDAMHIYELCTDGGLVAAP